jgi:hypothetical protein
LLKVEAFMVRTICADIDIYGVACFDMPEFMDAEEDAEYFDLDVVCANCGQIIPNKGFYVDSSGNYRLEATLGSEPHVDRWRRVAETDDSGV